LLNSRDSARAARDSLTRDITTAKIIIQNILQQNVTLDSTNAVKDSALLRRHTPLIQRLYIPVRAQDTTLKAEFDTTIAERDSLAALLVLRDSTILSRNRALALALAGLDSAAKYNLAAEYRIGKLEQDLKRVTRIPKFLGLPLPEFQVTTGPSLPDGHITVTAGLGYHFRIGRP
jgi:hypothetical protein